jgi:CBS domain-containing protein
MDHQYVPQLCLVRQADLEDDRDRGSEMKTTVGEVMTRDVYHVASDAPFKEITRKLVSSRVGALPVLSGDGRLIGIVSESDLLLKEAVRGCTPERPPIGWLTSRRRRKAAARVAQDLMTSRPITISADARVDQAARRMLRHRVKHLPVIDETGRLVGIVSRSDLLKAYVRRDEQVERDVLAAVGNVLGAGLASVTVKGGVATLTGRVPWHRDSQFCASAAASTDGVVGVDNRLTFEADERTLAVAGYWPFVP